MFGPVATGAVGHYGDPFCCHSVITSQISVGAAPGKPNSWLRAVRLVWHGAGSQRFAFYPKPRENWDRHAP